MFHLQAGTQHDPFETPQVIHHTDSTWIQQFIAALKKYNISIIRPNRIQLNIQRDNDIAMMDHAMQHIQNKKLLCQINTCRQYLHVIYLSDVITHDGSTIKPEIYHKIPLHSRYNGHILYLQTMPPGNSSSHIFKRTSCKHHRIKSNNNYN